MLCRRAAAQGASWERGGVDSRTSPAGQGHTPRACRAAGAPRIHPGRALPSTVARRLRGAAQGRSAPLPREPGPTRAGAGHGSRLPPPPWGSPRPPSPLSARSWRALLGPNLCPAPVGLPGRSPAGAGRVEALRPPLPRDSRGPSHPSLHSDRSFAKFLPDTFPPSPERGEPAGAAVRPAALPAPCPLPPPLSGRRDGAELRLLSPPRW